MKNDLSFEGLYGESVITFVRDAIHIAPIEIILGKYDQFVKPHLHNNLFQIFLIEESVAKLHCYNQSFTIDTMSFFTIPKNIIHGISSEEFTRGWVISISDLALEKTLKLDADIFKNLDEVNIVSLDLKNKLHKNFYHTLHKCINEYNDNQPARDLALEYLTGMLLIRLFRILEKSENLITQEQNVYKIQYRRFRELIKSNYSFKYNVEFYAEQLSISSSHLTRICNDVTNESPKKIIAKYFINEAKILLMKLDYSISDVAYKLGFDDPSYFTRLFKQVTGDTPRNFRKKSGL